MADNIAKNDVNPAGGGNKKAIRVVVETEFMKQIREKAQSDLEKISQQFLEINTPVITKLVDALNSHQVFLAIDKLTNNEIFKQVQDLQDRASQFLELQNQLAKITENIIFPLSSRPKQEEHSLPVINHVEMNPVPTIQHTQVYRISVEDARILAKEIIREMVTEFRMDLAKPIELQTAENTVVLHLSKEGDLFKASERSTMYQMVKGSIREKIVRFLAQSKGFNPTSVIMSKVNSRVSKSVSEAIRQVNSKAKALIGLEFDLIEGRKGSGYRINEKYRVELE